MDLLKCFALHFEIEEMKFCPHHVCSEQKRVMCSFVADKCVCTFFFSCCAMYNPTQVNCASTITQNREIGDDGLEKTFATNTLGEC